MTEQPTSILAQFSNDLANAVERAGKSVVKVNARRPHNPASGIVWAPGIVVTADHVLEREEEITVGTADGADQPATIAGRDPSTDIAILKVSGELAVAERGPEPRVGHFVLAIGRNPGISATAGVVSSIAGPARTSRGGRLDGFIRTDAVLYPGFSGGPLVDAEGRVIGLTTTHFGGSLAIPAGAVAAVVDTLLAHGRIKKAFLGITSQPVPIPDSLRTKVGGAEGGLMIVGVVDGGPAQTGGLFIGDVIVEVAGQAVRDTDQLQQTLTADKIGQPTPVTVLRGGEAKTVTIVVGERK